MNVYDLFMMLGGVQAEEHAAAARSISWARTAETAATMYTA
jgi:hypothetical protein